MLKSLRAILVHLHAYTGLSEMYFGFLKFNNKKLISCIFGTGNVLCIQKLSRIPTYVIWLINVIFYDVIEIKQINEISLTVSILYDMVGNRKYN